MTHKINELPPLQGWANNTDFVKLRLWKKSLEEIKDTDDSVEHIADCEDMIEWIDNFQKIMVESYGINPKLVYGDETD